MKTVAEVCQFLDNLFPIALAESWDNTGLLVGDRSQAAQNVMTCLTISPASVQEAIVRDVNLIVSHHPLPFRPLAQITTDSISGKMLWQLIGAGIAVYSPHTRFDSGTSGINEMLCGRLGLSDIRPLALAGDGSSESLGSGRLGRISTPLVWADWIARIKSTFGMRDVRAVVSPTRKVERVAVACGSGGSLLSTAIEQGCDTFVTGEMNFHSCLECQSRDVALILLGHYQSERFGIERLASQIQNGFGDLAVWASERESDPISTF